MNNRERFGAAMAFEGTDRPCHIEHGFWPETYQRWQKEGLPAEINEPPIEYLSPEPDLFDYFDITRYSYVLRSQYFIPPFETEVIQETERHLIQRDGLGRVVQTSKVSASLPHYLEHPVKTLKDYDALRERLQPRLKERYPKNWDALAEEMRTQQRYLVCTHMDGFFGHPREMMGVENLLMAYYDHPELIRTMINDRCEFYMTVYEKAIRDVQPDFAFIWEDMCFCNGPLISPKLFREFMLPAYQKLTDFLRGLGIKIIIVDSDGDIRSLIPLWIEAGVTGLLPFEAKAVDSVKIGQEYPKFQIIGGINKHAFEKGKTEMDCELERVLPTMLKRRGYVVSLDHWVQPEIPLDNYRYFVERVRGWK